MSSGKLILKVKNQGIIFERNDAELPFGGDMNTYYLKFGYSNGLGYSCTLGDILFEEGTLGGGGDYIRVLADVTTNLAQDGLLPVKVEIQSDRPVNDIYNVQMIIFNSPIFIFTVTITP